MSRKKIILISLLAITVIVSSFVAFHFFSNDSSSKVDTSKQLKTNIKEEEKKDKTDNKETEKEETNPEITTPQTNETEKQNIEETPKENPNNNVHTTPQPQTPSNNQTTTKQPTTPPKVVETPSCTPKLFYVVFRADFDSLDKLKAMAEQYKEIYGFTGYEYMSATDDCGDTYYQLTMKAKDDKLVEYSDIPKP